MPRVGRFLALGRLVTACVTQSAWVTPHKRRSVYRPVMLHASLGAHRAVTARASVGRKFITVRTPSRPPIHQGHGPRLTSRVARDDHHAQAPWDQATSSHGAQPTARFPGAALCSWRPRIPANLPPI